MLPLEREGVFYHIYTFRYDINILNVLMEITKYDA